MSSLIDKGKVADKISDLFLDKYEAKANSDLMEFYKEVLKILINEQGQSNWISVKDRLPEKRGNYLTVYQCQYSGGIFVGTDWFLSECGYFWNNSQTLYWMPLPEPPESE